MRWLVSYNLEAVLTVRLKWASRLLSWAKNLSGSVAIMLYTLGGATWEQAWDAMRYTFAPVPMPTDARLRGLARWFVSAHFLYTIQRVMHPADVVRARELGQLIDTLRPFALIVISFCRDMRHAKLLQGPDLSLIHI